MTRSLNESDEEIRQVYQQFQRGLLTAFLSTLYVQLIVK